MMDELTKEDILCKMEELAEKGKLVITKKQNFRILLRLMARFPEFSVENLVLLLVQRPKARCLGTKEMWEEIENPVRENAQGIFLLNEEGEPEAWYDIGDTTDVPNEAFLDEERYPEGILSVAAIRWKSPFFKLIHTEPGRSIYLGIDFEGRAMKQLAERLVFGAPFCVKAADLRKWVYYRDLREPFFWNEQNRMLTVRRGVTGEELVQKLIFYHAYITAKNQGTDVPMEVAKGVTYVLGCMFGIGGFEEAIPRELMAGMENKGIEILTSIRSMITITLENIF